MSVTVFQIGAFRWFPGGFPNTANEQIVLFSSLPIGRYLRLVALSEVNGRPFTSIAEINVTGAFCCRLPG